MRVIDVDWDGGRPERHLTAAVEVFALDRSQLLRDVANALAEQHVNIVSCQTLTGDDRVAKMRFEFELTSPDQIRAVLATIRRVESVYDVHRILPGGSPESPD